MRDVACLLQASAMVETQMDTGSADRVPDLLGQLQNATASGQLMVCCLPSLLAELI